MVSRRQWFLIAVCVVYGFVSAGGGLAYRFGAAVGWFVLVYAVAAGYNGVNLTGRLSQVN